MIVALPYFYYGTPIDDYEFLIILMLGLTIGGLIYGADYVYKRIKKSTAKPAEKNQLPRRR